MKPLSELPEWVRTYKEPTEEDIKRCRQLGMMIRRDIEKALEWSVHREILHRR